MDSSARDAFPITMDRRYSSIVRARIGVLMPLIVSSCACSDRVDTLSLSGLEGRVVVLARVDADRRVREGTVGHGTETAYFDAEAGDTLHAFFFEPDDVRLSDGTILGPEDVLSWRVLTEDRSDSICSACRVPVSSPPFVLDPGSRCAVPEIVGHRQSQAIGEAPLPPEQVAQIRAQLRLDSPGDCNCRPTPSQPVRGPFQGCEPEAGPAPHRWLSAAIADDGHFVAADLSTLAIGTEVVEPTFIPLAEPFVRTPSVLGLEGSRFLVVGQIRTRRLADVSEQRMLIVEGEAQEEIDPISEPGSVVTGALFDPRRREVFLFGASVDGNEGRVWRCDATLDSCVGSEVPGCGPIDATQGRKNLSSAALLANGDLVAVTLDGSLVQLSAQNDEWTCRPRDAAQTRITGPAAASATTLHINALGHGLVAGGRLFACGQGENGPDAPESLYSVVVTASVSSGGHPWHSSELQIHVEPASGGACVGLWHDGRTNEVEAFIRFPDRLEVLAFTTSGAFLGHRSAAGLADAGAAPRFSNLEEPVGLVVDSRDRTRILAVGNYGGLYAGGAQAITALGPRPPLSPAYALPGADDVLLLGGGAPMAWNGGCEATSLTPVAPLDARLEVATSFDDGRALALTGNEVIVYDRALGIIERWPLSPPPLLQAGLIGDRHAVLLDESGVAWALSLDERELKVLPLEVLPGVAGEAAFKYLSTSPSFGWLSGPGLARVRVGRTGLVAELWWSGQIEATLLAGPEPLEVESFFASSILCTGDSVVFVRGIARNLDRPQYLGRSVMLASAPDGHRYLARVLPGFSDQARFGATSFRERATKISASSLPILGFGNGMIVRPDSVPWYPPNPLFTSIVELEDRAVITDRAGLRTFLRSP